MTEAGVLPWSLEWWHLVITLTLLVGGVVVKATLSAIRAFATGFSNWAEKLDQLRQSMDDRLAHMEKDFAVRMSGMESKFVQHQGEVHNLTIRVERRVTWLEAHMHRERGIRPLEDHTGHEPGDHRR